MKRPVTLLLSLCLASARLAAASDLPPNFQETTVFSGLVFPTVVKFAPDGRVFVAEKSGLIKVFASLTAPAPTIFADLRPQVQDYWDRGLLGMELDPAFPTRPYVYVLYALDRNPADPTSTIPTWGDTCPSPPGPQASGCTVVGRLSRLDASAPWPVEGTEQVLLEGFPHQFPSHSVGGLAFGPEGALYISGGEGASFTVVDYGQLGGQNGAGPGQRVPVNPFGDPPTAAGIAPSPPNAQGGALRSQSVRRPAGQPVVLSGVVLRVDPNTGLGLPDNPLFGSPDVNARRIIAYGLRNPFRFALRPGTREIWVGDVGWNQTEEINRFDVAAGTAPNFGWPCYEGSTPQPGYQAAGLASCQSLYAEGTGRVPYFEYAHTDAVVPGDGCPAGTSSVSGFAFYTTGTYPSILQGALFFTDWARHCIWAMLPGPTGIPDPTRLVAFASRLSGGAVNLERGPGGDIFYVDYDTGRVQRISYFGANQPPIARATATPASGASPLAVQFDASGSVDPEGGALTYSWDLDGDGVFGDSTLANPTWTFITSGKHTATVRVRDILGATSTASADVYADNRPPHAVITALTPSIAWKVGDTISFAGVATDPEQGTLPPSALQWRLMIHHCPSLCHIHVVQTWNGIAGGSFTAPDHEYPSWLELTLTATDSGGLSDTASVSIQPQTVTLTFQTTPAGLTLAVGDSAAATPFTRTVIVGSSNSVSAPSPQSIAGQALGFRSWSDGGSATHLVAAPLAATTFTATYQPFADLSLTYTLSPAAAVTRSRVNATATVANHGPMAATNIQIAGTLPAGATFLGSSPPVPCATFGSAFACSAGDLEVGAASSITVTLRVSATGPLSLTGLASCTQADPNPADNVATASGSVRPLGDLNGDGNEDLLWGSTSGPVIAVLMAGPTITGSATLTPARGSDPNWRLGGLGDFDGDGKPDLMWRNQSTGADEIWTMDGMNRKAIVPVFTLADPAWQIAAVADFNGDGWPDLFWHHSSGTNVVVYMNGATPIGTGGIPAIADPAWQIAGVPDLNGDGKPDVVWRHTTDGLTYVWYLDGVTVIGAAALFSVADVSWAPVSFADLNGDGRPDLVLRHQPSGTNVVIYMDGVAVIGWALLPVVPDTTWTVIAPR